MTTSVSAKSKSGGIVGTIKTIIIAVLIALGVRTFLYEPFNIPTGSMVPTLLVGDYLFVSKFAYGYGAQTLLFGMPAFEGRIFASEPERGDVIVFRLPTNPSEHYIKRLIGLPGDEIQMIEGRLYINGEMVERERIEDYVYQGTRYMQYIETLPNGVAHNIIERSDSAGLDNTPVYTVPEDHYFFMGDNRDGSLDSRVPGRNGQPPQVGYVPGDNLVGRAEVIWFSLEDSSFFEIWNWPTSLRFSRLLDAVN